MEIRNALQKIENYLTVVSNLNRTILSEGTMSRDELLLMKKYLYTSIDRVEDIERSLIIDQRNDKTFTPAAPIETPYTPAKEKEIVEVAGTAHEEQVEAVLNASTPLNELPLPEEVQTEQLPEEKILLSALDSVLPEPTVGESNQMIESKEENMLEILPLVESIITEDYALNQYKDETVENPFVTEEEFLSLTPTKSFAESIITEDYSLNRLFENPTETSHSLLVNEQNEVLTVFAEKKQETVANIITEDYSLNRAAVITTSVQQLVNNEENRDNALVSMEETSAKSETLASQFEGNNPRSFVDVLENNRNEQPSFIEQLEQKQSVNPQPQLFEMFDPGKEELYETFSSANTFNESLCSTAGVPNQVQDEPVLVAEKEVETLIEELTPSSLNDIFKSQTPTDTLTVKVNKTLSESIALNDKFIFVRELFGNQFSEYENGLKQLDTLTTFDLAQHYCKEKLWNKFNWGDKAPSVERFMAVLQKRFN